LIDEIETNVNSLRDGNNVSFKKPIGEEFYISITIGFYCVDIRKFFVPYGETDIKPTRQHIAPRLRE